jgi:hypothetical protein
VPEKEIVIMNSKVELHDQVAAIREVEWRKSGRSVPISDNCVEVAPISGGGVAVRDSKDPAGPRLAFTPDEFAAFVGGAKDGDFDDLI